MPDDVEVVRRLFAAVEDRDIGRVLACYSDNVEITEADVLPYGGVWRGRDGAVAHAEGFMRAWGELQGPAETRLDAQFWGDAGTVCAVFRHQAVDPLSGKRFDAPEVGIYRVSDGRVVQSQMFHADSAAVKRYLERCRPRRRTIGTAMIERWQHWGPVSGLLLCITWAPMAFVVPRLPDLGSAQRVESYWRDNQVLMQGVILSVSVGFLFLLVFLGALVEVMRSAAGAGAVCWTAFGGAVMFMTALNVALGLDIAGGLIIDADPASTYVLHTAAFLLAAPAAFAGTAFFVAVTAFTWEVGLFPRWTVWIAGIGVLANAGTVLGILTLTGPLNSGNGLVGGIAAPLGMFLVWTFVISVWWIRCPPAVPSSGIRRSPRRSAPAGPA